VNWRLASIIWRKELLDTLRDRRTIISMIVVPVLVMPVLIFGLGSISMKVVAKARAEIPTVMIIGGADSPGIVGRLQRLETIKVVPYRADYTNQISGKSVRAAVEIPPGFEASLSNGPPQKVQIYIYGGEIKSSFGAAPLQNFFQRLREEIIHQRLSARQLPEEFLRPFSYETVNVAPPKKITGNILGAIIPYMIILLCMTGAMYPAMDLTAGEKERGTVETLLCSPVARVNIVLGKFLTVLTTALATTLFSLFSLGGSFLLAKNALLGPAALALPKGFGVDWASLAMVFLMILPVAVFLSAAQLAIALFAKSFKEAQSYLSPLMIVVILPAVMGMLPGMELNARLALAPILNTSLVCKEILTGVYPWGLIALIFGSSCAYAALALAAAVRLFNQEKVLFRT